MDKKQLTERDICTKYILPAVKKAGWDIHTQIREEVTLTAGRVIVRGQMGLRSKGKRADFENQGSKIRGQKNQGSGPKKSGVRSRIANNLLSLKKSGVRSRIANNLLSLYILVYGNCSDIQDRIS